MKKLIVSLAALAALAAPAVANNTGFDGGDRSHLTAFEDNSDIGEKVTPSIVTAIGGGTVTAGDGVTPVTTSQYLPSAFSQRQSN